MAEEYTVVYRGAEKGTAKRAREDVREMYDVPEGARLGTVQETIQDAIVDGERVPVATIVRVTVET